MKTLILITGDLATGKTTLAKELSNYLSYPYIYKDKIKELLCDRIGFKNRCENKTISFATFDVINFIAEQLLSSSTNLIIESNFRQNELDELFKLTTKYNYRLLTIVLSADIDTLYKRYENRLLNENRHIAHQNFNSYPEFKEYVISARERTYYGKVIKIDANDFSLFSPDFYQNIKELLTK